MPLHTQWHRLCCEWLGKDCSQDYGMLNTAAGAKACRLSQTVPHNNCTIGGTCCARHPNWDKERSCLTFSCPPSRVPK